MRQVGAASLRSAAAIVAAGAVLACLTSVAAGADAELELRQYGEDISRGPGVAGGFGGFGHSVAVSSDGTALIVGEPTASEVPDTPDLDYYGRASVFQRDGAAWNLRTELAAMVKNDTLGRSAAISADGGRMIAGSGGFVMTTDSDRGVLPQTLEGKQLGDGFGASVALSASGSRLAVAAKGYARIYDWDDENSVWVQRSPDIEGPADSFPWYVAISDEGNRVAVEGVKDTVTLDWDAASSTWVEVARMPRGADTRAVALSADGRRLVMNSHLETGGGNGLGVVATFDWDDTTSSWVRTAVIRDTTDDAVIGTAGSLDLSADGNWLVVGTGVQAGWSYDGVASVFRWDSATASWAQIGANQRGSEGDTFGYSVAIADDDRLIAVGAPGGGYVRLFEIVEPSSSTTTIPATTQSPAQTLPETGGSTTTGTTLVGLVLVMMGLLALGAARRQS